jgi:hypothetical protein
MNMNNPLRLRFSTSSTVLVLTAVSGYEWLQMQKPAFHHNKFFKPLQRWDKCINVLRDYAKKQKHLSGINELHLPL